jgi:hypothetical protein
MRVLLVAVAIPLLFATASATVWTVDWSGGGDFALIQEGVDVASYGDTVWVARGYYNERVVMKDGVALLGEGADRTVIDGTGWNYSTVDCDGSFSADTVIEGFRIMGGTGPGWSASGVWLGIDCSAVVQYNVIIGNRMGIMINYNNGDPLVDHNTIVFNSDCGIQVYVGNWTVVSGVATITNNIVYENSNSGIYRASDSTTKDPPMPIVDYNDVFSNGYLDYGSVLPGANDISADPVFCMPPMNLDLDETSPCVGAGSGGGNMGALKVGCEPTPVENESWGVIKSLFR